MPPLLLLFAEALVNAFFQFLTLDQQDAFAIWREVEVGIGPDYHICTGGCFCAEVQRPSRGGC